MSRWWTRAWSDSKSGDSGTRAGACRGAAVDQKGNMEDRHAEKDHDHGLQAASEPQMARRQAVHLEGFRVRLADRQASRVSHARPACAGNDFQDRNPRRSHDRDSLERSLQRGLRDPIHSCARFPAPSLARRIQRRRHEGVRQFAVLEQELCRRRRIPGRRVGWRQPHGARSIQ